MCDVRIPLQPGTKCSEKITTDMTTEKERSIVTPRSCAITPEANALHGELNNEALNLIIRQGVFM